MKIKNTLAAAAIAATLVVHTAHAQSLVGRWDGTSTTQQGRTAVTFTFDSVAAGWKGSWTSDSYGSGPMSVVELKKDTVSFSFAIQNTSIDMQGTLNADRKVITGFIWVGGSDAGTFQVTRFAPPAKTPPPRH